MLLALLALTSPPLLSVLITLVIVGVVIRTFGVGGL